MITGEILNHVPRKGIVTHPYFYNAAIRLQYSRWKVAKTIMLSKRGTKVKEVVL